MRWINVEQPVGATVLGYVVLATIILLVGGIALRLLVSLRRGEFLPDQPLR